MRALTQRIQEVTSDAADIAFVKQGYTGAQTTAGAAVHDSYLEVIMLPTAKRVLLLQRWAVEHSSAW